MNQHIREIHNNPNEVPQTSEAGDVAEELARLFASTAAELPRFIETEEWRASSQFRARETVACEQCGKVLADPSSLYRHRKIHDREKSHKCPHCEK